MADCALTKEELVVVVQGFAREKSEQEQNHSTAVTKLKFLEM